MSDHVVAGQRAPADDSTTTPLVKVVTSGDDSMGMGMGEFRVVVKGKTWLASDGVHLRHHNQLCTVDNGKLVLTSSQKLSGTDEKLGKYEGVLWDWRAVVGDKPHMLTAIKWFESGNIVLFDQYFPEEVRASQSPGLNCSSAYIPGKLPSDAEFTWAGLASAFPTFRRAPGIAEEALGFMEYYGLFENGDNGGVGPNLGLWDDVDDKLFGGLSSGPLSLFNQEGVAAVISSHSNFMTTSADSSFVSSYDLGIMGSVESIPAGFTVSHVFFVSDRGINHAFEAWGSHLLSYYDKTPTRARDEDETNKYLGYSTDNGAYYYYHPESSKDMYQTLLDVHSYSKSEGIPYRNLLLDSWWYYRNAIDNSVVLWEAREDVFPGGNEGMRLLGEKTGWLFTAHNRYWSNYTKYDTLVGGQYEFVHDVESPCDAKLAYSLPASETFWEFLFEQATNQWGLYTYEQDWLWPQFLGMTKLLSDPRLGREWLMQMGKAASNNHVNIQYCMALPRHALQSVEIPAVTQLRASNDYGPTDRYWQWRVGRSSILIDAIGLAPSKDGIYTTTKQPGGSQGSFVERRPELEILVATMSTGPIQIADGIGYSNRSLIMRSCAEDGLLLKPSKAMTAMDFSLLEEAFNGTRGSFPNRSEIWGTHSHIGSEVWFHVLAADLQQALFLKLSDVLTHKGSSQEEELIYLAYSLPPLQFQINELKVIPLSARDAGAGFSLEVKDSIRDFELWHFAGVLDNGISILGELSKWVPVSPHRIKQISYDASQVVVVVRGSENEHVVFYFAVCDGNAAPVVYSESCVITGLECSITFSRESY